MTDKTYPLVSKLGLDMHRFQLNKGIDSWSERMVSARDLEKLLENLPVVAGIDDEECGVTSWCIEGFSPKHLEGRMDRRARLILDEPIKQDSATDLLREIMDELWFNHPLRIKAQAFLEREKEREGL